MTIQRAPFHEDGGSDSRPVMYTKALYVENQALAVIIVFGQIHGKYQSPLRPIASRKCPSNGSIMGFDGIAVYDKLCSVLSMI